MSGGGGGGGIGDFPYFTRLDWLNCQGYIGGLLGCVRLTWFLDARTTARFHLDAPANRPSFMDLA